MTKDSSSLSRRPGRILPQQVRGASVAPAALLPAGPPAPPGAPLEGPAHAARTTLTALSGALALLAAGLGGELPAPAIHLLAIARRNCVLLEGVIEQRYPVDAGDVRIP